MQQVNNELKNEPYQYSESNPYSYLATATWEPFDIDQILEKKLVKETEMHCTSIEPNRKDPGKQVFKEYVQKES